MTDQDATDPVVDDALRVSAENAPETELEGLEPELEAEGAEAEEGEEPAEPEEEEIELEGARYRIPKAVKPMLLMQQDYTRKTQELAQQRRALEQTRAHEAQADAEEVRLLGRLQHLAEQAQVYQGLDWDALEGDDPQEAQRAWRQREQIRESLAQAGGELQGIRRARAEQSAHGVVQAVQERERALADPERGISGWGAELGGKLTEYASREFGVGPQEIALETDPRAIQVLHRAYSLEQEVKSLRRRLGLQQQQSIRPAPKPGGSAGAGSRDLTRLSDADFLRRAEQKLRKGR